MKKKNFQTIPKELPYGIHKDKHPKTGEFIYVMNIWDCMVFKEVIYNEATGKWDETEKYYMIDENGNLTLD